MAPKTQKLHPFEEAERNFWSRGVKALVAGPPAGVPPAAAPPGRAAYGAVLPSDGRAKTPLLAFAPPPVPAARPPGRVQAPPVVNLAMAPLPSAAELLRLARQNQEVREEPVPSRVVAVRTAQPVAGGGYPEPGDAPAPPSAQPQPRNRVAVSTAPVPAERPGGSKPQSGGAAAVEGVEQDELHAVPLGPPPERTPLHPPDGGYPPGGGVYGATQSELGPEDAWYNNSVYVHPGEEPSPEEDMQRVVATSVLAITQLISPDLSLARLSTLHSGIGAKTLDTPAPFANAVWNVVYVGTLLFALYQAALDTRESLLLRRVGWYAATSFGATSVAAAATALSSRGPRLPTVLADSMVSAATVAWTVALCTAIAWALLMLAVRGLAAHVQPFSLGEHLCVVAPLSLYAGWVTILTSINYAGAALSSGALALSVLSPHRALAASLVLASGIAACAGVFTSRGNPWYAFGSVWGLLGVAASNWRFDHGRNVLSATSLVAATSVVALTALRILALRRNRWAVPWHDARPLALHALQTAREALTSLRARLAAARGGGDSEKGDTELAAPPPRPAPSKGRALPPPPPPRPPPPPVRPAAPDAGKGPAGVTPGDKRKAIQQGNQAALAALAASRAATGGAGATRSVPSSPAAKPAAAVPASRSSGAL